MKYKIQTRSVNGWADLKSSEDGHPYVLDLYDSVSLALEELDDLASLHGKDHYRVVCQTMPSDDDLY